MKNTINPYFKTFIGQNVVLNIHTHTQKAKPHWKAGPWWSYKTVKFTKETLD